MFGFIRKRLFIGLMSAVLFFGFQSVDTYAVNQVIYDNYFDTETFETVALDSASNNVDPVTSLIYKTDISLSSDFASITDRDNYRLIVPENKTYVLSMVSTAHRPAMFIYHIDETVEYISEESYNYVQFPYPVYQKGANGILFTVREDGTLVANGTATGFAEFNVEPIILSTRVLQPGKYRLSGVDAGGGQDTYYCALGDGYNRIATDNGQGAVFEITQPTRIALAVRIMEGQEVHDKEFKPMIVKLDENGDGPTEYKRGAKDNRLCLRYITWWEDYPNSSTAILPSGTYILNGVFPDFVMSETGVEISSINYLSGDKKGAEIIWNKLPGIKGYEIYSSINGSEYSLLKDIDASKLTKVEYSLDTVTEDGSKEYVKFLDETVEVGNTYSYKVLAYGDFGKTEMCSAKDIYIDLNTPTVPANAEAKKSKNGITVSWEKADAADGYEIYRSVDKSSFDLLTKVTDVSKTSFEDTSARPAHDYVYKVKSYNKLHSSEFSEPVTAPRLDMAPTISSLKNTGNGLKLQWSEVKYATGYEIYRKTGSGNMAKLTTVASGATTSYDDKTAKEGVTYTYAVKTKYGKVTTEMSKTYSGVCLDAPEINAIEGKCEKAVFSWDAVAGADTYAIYRKLGSGKYSLVKTVKNATRFSDTDVLKAKSYSYKVVAKKGNSESLASKEVSVKIIGHDTSSKVTPATNKKNGKIVTTCKRCNESNTKTIYMAKSISVDLSEYTYTGKAIKPSVKILDSKNGKISSTNYSVTYSNNKEVGKASYTITFKNNYSGKITKTFKIIPKAPVIKTITGQKNAFTISVNAPKGITGYEVWYSLSPSMDNVIKVKVDGTKAASIKKLKSGTQYYVKVRSYQNVKEGKKTVAYYSNLSESKKVVVK